MQCEFSKAELILLDLGIIDRRDRTTLALDDLDPSKKNAKSIKKLLETDLKRIEALHDKLSKFIENLDVKGDNKE